MADAMMMRRGGAQNGKVNFSIANSNRVIHQAETPLSVARSRLVAATDGAGNVLFAGGSTGYNLSVVVDRYSPGGVRTTLPPWAFSREGIAAATDGAGNVLFGGGVGHANEESIYYAAVDCYSPGGVRTTLTALSVARYYLAAATDGAGNVLFGGGEVEGYAGTAAVDRYSPGGVRTTLTALSAARHSLAAATDGAGNVLFGGGYLSVVVDRYSPSGVRTVLTPLSTGSDLSAATDGAGNVLFGGPNSSGIDRYDKEGNHSVIAALSVPRSSPAAATDRTGNVLFGGGGSSSNVVDSYTPTGIRTTLEALTEGRSGLAAAADANGKVYFAGGYSGASSSASAKAERYFGVYDLAVYSGSRYRFKEHSAEQTAAAAGIITLDAPNEGYVKFGKVTL
ncbi:Kelch repeat-containing protein [Acidaminobacterium chupaoyuni]